MRGVLLLLLFAGCSPPLDPTFTNIKAEIFEPRCNTQSCHGGFAPKSDLGLVEDAHAALVDVDSEEDPTRKRVAPGDPEASVLFRVLKGDDPVVDPMPDGLRPGAIGAEHLELVRAWIEAGAPDD